jgi:hypothetical protein
VIEGRPAVFISCSDKFKSSVAYVYRDAIHAYGLEPVIVSDAPSHGARNPDEKVNFYLEHCEGFVALCTPDDQLANGAFQVRPNICEELGRAGQLPHLASRIYVVKVASVLLPSNTNFPYDPLELDNLAPALVRLIQQLRVWRLSVDEQEAQKRHAGPREPSVEADSSRIPPDLIAAMNWMHQTQTCVQCLSPLGSSRN